MLLSHTQTSRTTYELPRITVNDSPTRHRLCVDYLFAVDGG
ncbi:conserved protein of unknown function [Limnospira indica PCC 8005]|uniref:Uncharacterized protein n=1 Tax=Limnospira indica PCC 8005 TaxID=376219 RepID=A0A9P1NYM2_9CYAN|nr:conserved protein of unknown function [Limnospira indica PCC 8005]